MRGVVEAGHRKVLEDGQKRDEALSCILSGDSDTWWQSGETTERGNAQDGRAVDRRGEELSNDKMTK